MPDIYICDIVSNERLRETVYAITAECPGFAACAGQFVGVKCGEERLLRRPISICNADGGRFTLVFEALGDGTRWLSQRKTGQRLDILGPLGNGFHVPNGNIIVVGGGIGVPPLLFAARSAKGAVTAVLGFRDSSRIILKEEFESACKKVIIATDDGSSGFHGTVSPPLTELLESGAYDSVIACGPLVMLKAAAEISKQHGVQCMVSLEERMACGVGACMVCACAAEKDGERRMSRVCRDGPVFDAEEVMFI